MKELKSLILTLLIAALGTGYALAEEKASSSDCSKAKSCCSASEGEKHDHEEKE